MRTYMSEITTKVVFDQDVIDSVIEMAGYGIGYWAGTALHDRENRTYAVGGLYEDEDTGKVFTITYDDIAEALVDLASGKVSVRDEYIQYARSAVLENDGGDIDSEVADLVIQYAIYGEIVYG